MAHWIKCTRISDHTAIYINLETASWLRWNDEEGFTAVSWTQREENIVRVWERPEQLIEALKEPAKAG